jgi:NhaA family Na+:H+ antiporter
MNLRDIIKSEVFSGLLLIISLVCALVLSNSIYYEDFLKVIYFPISLKLDVLQIRTTTITVINHGLMTLFFLVVGLEMKRHLVNGHYQEKKKLILPLAAALGGLVVPALIYYSLNFDGNFLKGWAVPIATDTAFELAILSFFKRKISLDLRIFVLGFSLIDDFLAITVLTIFYSKTMTLFAFSIDILLVSLLFLLNYYEVRKIRYYLLVGTALWVALERSGVHGTLAGIIIAIFIPAKIKDNNVSPLEKLEHNLTPYVNYLILPIFAFFNSELNAENVVFDDLFTNLSLGIMLGLFFGKQIGIFTFSYLSVMFKYCRLPENTSWLKFYAIAVLGGVGFTLSLFIGGIAFSDQWALNTMKSAVIISSFLSAVVGIIFLKFLKE